MHILPNIHSHQDLVNLNDTQRAALCAEIRENLVSQVSATGGHLASNLGVVELTVALETVFDTAKDRLVFDVGHQSYIHKMLTGRQGDFANLRQFGGMAGFPKPGESETDAFVAGHASSSVSIALGMARARTLQKEDYQVIALLGDGAATGGMVYEGLNDAAVSKEPMIVVLNDNAMSIDRNVGGMASHLRALRTKQRYLGMKNRYRNALGRIPGGKFMYRFTRSIKDWMRRMLLPMTIFENMGFTYLGPVDGHDTENLIQLLQNAKDLKRPVLLHVITQKGRGYAPAEKEPRSFHGVGKFDPETGKPLKASSYGYSDAFGDTMVALGAENPKVCAITAAMPGGTGLLNFKKTYPERLFDVGIAEEHAVSMAGGLAKQGMIPVVAIYSTFLQRAYDMILQDICMLNLHVVFCVDRAGLVGEDGETHHGVFDTGFLRQAPNMKVLCPASQLELSQMLNWAVNEYDGPVAIRYPRGTEGSYKESSFVGTDSRLACHKQGKDITILTYGNLLDNALQAAEILQEKGVDATVLRLLSLTDMPAKEIAVYLDNQRRLVILEEVCENSGIKESLAWQLAKLGNYRVDGLDLGHRFSTHGAVKQLHTHYGLSPEKIVEFIMEGV